MEYYEYHTVHELFLYGDLTLQQWVDVFNRIRFVCDDFKRYTVKGREYPARTGGDVFDKDITALRENEKREYIFDFFEEPIEVNGEKYLPLNDISAVLEKSYP